MTNLPIACELSAEQIGASADELIPGLAARARLVREHPDGLVIELAAEPGMLARVAAVIDRERQCCRFLRFSLTVESAGGPIVLEITGPAGTREFLASLLAPDTASG